MFEKLKNALGLSTKLRNKTDYHSPHEVNNDIDEIISIIEEVLKDIRDDNEA